MATVRGATPSKLRPKGNTRRILQHARRHTVRCGKSFKNWLLLAYMHKDTKALIKACQECQAHRTVIKSNNRETPFSLTYGMEAVIPVEIGMPTLRTTKVDLVQNNEALEINIFYWVQGTSFKPGDLVYYNNDASRAEDTGKLSPKWEGPYEVTEALGKGAYKLRDRDGKQLPQTWNISNLKKCYVHKM
ncbi:reverse transcriptase domain-containing protein [Tanacetum coccineum]